MKRQNKKNNPGAADEAEASTRKAQLRVALELYCKEVGAPGKPLSQGKLAGFLGVSPESVSGYKRGKYPPSAEIVIKLINSAPSEHVAEMLFRQLRIDVSKMRAVFGSPSEGAGANTAMAEVPLLDADNAEGGPWLNEVVPKAWLRSGSEMVAVRVRTPMRLFPFLNGDIAYLEKGRWPVRLLLGELIAVHLEKYPEKIISADRHEGEFDLQGINLGWLVIERPNDPGRLLLSGRKDSLSDSDRPEPWRLKLQGADVPGICRSAPALELTEWQMSTARELKEFMCGEPSLKVDLLPWVKILGRVDFWKRENLFPLLSDNEA